MPDQPTKGGTFRFATLSDIRGLDPAVAFDTESQPLLELLFDGLVDYDEKGKIVPQLAERFETSADGKTYTFFLRSNVQMHDGSLLTAADVQRSIERTLHPDTPCPAAAFFDHILGFADFQGRSTPHISGVSIEGDRVVRIRLSQPDATFLQVLAMPFLRPVCKSAGSTYEDQFQRKVCGSGPFRLDSWEPGRRMRLARFDGHRDAHTTWLDAIELFMDVPKLTQRYQFERTELDFIGEFERPDFLFYRTHPQWSKFGIERIESAVYGEFMNVEMKPFDDVRVRRAVAAGIHRPNLQKYMEGGSHVTGHLLPPGIPGYDEHFPGQTYDLAKARALMAEAGYPYNSATGTGGYPEEIEYLAGEGESALRWAQLLQYDLAQIGLRLHIKVTSFGQYLALTGRPKTVAMGWTGWNLDYPDPSDFFEPIFSSKSILPEESQNHAFYRNPKLDLLLDQAHGELDERKRLAMYREAETIVVEDAPWAFTYYPMKYELLQPTVQGYRGHPVWNRYFRTVWKSPDDRLAHSGAERPDILRALGNLFGPTRVGWGRPP